MNHQVPQNETNFFALPTSTIGFSRWPLLHGVESMIPLFSKTDVKKDGMNRWERERRTINVIYMLLTHRFEKKRKLELCLRATGSSATADRILRVSVNVLLFRARSAWVATCNHTAISVPTAHYTEDYLCGYSCVISTWLPARFNTEVQGCRNTKLNNVHYLPIFMHSLIKHCCVKDVIIFWDVSEKPAAPSSKHKQWIGSVY
jgi:hypothetical protein